MQPYAKFRRQSRRSFRSFPNHEVVTLSWEVWTACEPVHHISNPAKEPDCSEVDPQFESEPSSSSRKLFDCCTSKTAMQQCGSRFVEPFEILRDMQALCVWKALIARHAPLQQHHIRISGSRSRSSIRMGPATELSVWARRLIQGKDGGCVAPDVKVVLPSS